MTTGSEVRGSTKGSKVLGISEEHDAGVALVSDAGIVFASSEERYSRKKFQDGTPGGALGKLVKYVSPTGSLPLSSIAVASKFHSRESVYDWLHLDWKYAILETLFSFLHLDRLLWGSHLGPRLLSAIGYVQQLVRRRRLARLLHLQLLESKARIRFIDHHTCHAAAAYYTSGWNDCLVITQDASGDGYCSKVFACDNGRMEEKHAVPFFHSPGYYYTYITYMFGFKVGGEGKVTGLAARGSPEKTYHVFKKQMAYEAEKKQYVNYGGYRRPEMKTLQKLLAGYSREDIAAGVQKHLEEMMMSYVRDMVVRHAPKLPVRLALGGGVFGNVKLNQEIAKMPEVASIYVYPHMGDGGLAAGAAFQVLGEFGCKPQDMPNVYLGDEPSQEEIRHALALHKGRLAVTVPDSLADEVADFLSRGKVVAVVRGKMEYGPRALGHRSLLCQATDPTVNNWLNKRLRRSEFMPFAPIVREEDLELYFTGWEKVLPSLPFMTVTVNCSNRCRDEAPAIVHVDGTARPQIVKKEVTPFLYDVISAYYQKTGKRILINTSFNIHEQPIVRTAEEAVETFLEGHIDRLVLGDCLVASN